MKTTISILYLFILTLAGTLPLPGADYRDASNRKSLKELVGEKVSLTGSISRVPWQHISGSFKGYPYNYYFDLKETQIIIYTPKKIQCTGALTVYGTVVEVKGLSKGDPREAFREYHLLAERWDCR